MILLVILYLSVGGIVIQKGYSISRVDKVRRGSFIPAIAFFHSKKSQSFSLPLVIHYKKYFPIDRVSVLSFDTWYKAQNEKYDYFVIDEMVITSKSQSVFHAIRKSMNIKDRTFFINKTKNKIFIIPYYVEGAISVEISGYVVDKKGNESPFFMKEVSEVDYEIHIGLYLFLYLTRGG